jgi:hypothetical protein
MFKTPSINSQKKTSNNWIEFVKQYAKHNNLSYSEAMKEAKQHYKIQGKVNKKSKAITGGGITAKTEKGKKILQRFEVVVDAFKVGQITTQRFQQEFDIILKYGGDAITDEMLDYMVTVKKELFDWLSKPDVTEEMYKHFQSTF